MPTGENMTCNKSFSFRALCSWLNFNEVSSASKKEKEASRVLAVYMSFYGSHQRKRESIHIYPFSFDSLLFISSVTSSSVSDFRFNRLSNLIPWGFAILNIEHLVKPRFIFSFSCHPLSFLPINRFKTINCESF